MKKIEIKEFGGPEVLEIKNVDIGKPGQNEVLVKNLSIGINYIDTYHVQVFIPSHCQVVLDLKLVVLSKK